MNVRKEIEELTRIRHLPKGRSDEEAVAFHAKTEVARERIRGPEDFAAYLRFLAVDMEKCSHPMEKSQWEFLMDLADLVDEDVADQEAEKNPERIWPALAEACANATS